MVVNFASRSRIPPRDSPTWLEPVIEEEYTAANEHG
jgi:hypothetical protein